MEKHYIGDGVFIQWDGYRYILTVENGVTVKATIYLEVPVYLNLVDYVTRQNDGNQQTENR
jgi:hypothetical protein